MSKATPGPWIVTHSPTSCGSAYRIGQPAQDKGCAWIYADGIRKGIDDQLPRAIELAANARLIAAAPCLLEALQEAIEREFNPFEPDNQSAFYRRWSAIAAKATGGKQ